jgi:hypothetical protein
MPNPPRVVRLCRRRGNRDRSLWRGRRLPSHQSCLAGRYQLSAWYSPLLPLSFGGHQSAGPHSGRPIASRSGMGAQICAGSRRQATHVSDLKARRVAHVELPTSRVGQLAYPRLGPQEGPPVAGIRIADIPHGNLHVRKGANSSSLSCQFASIATADAWLVLHANGTTNTPSNANAASIAHASLTLQTKAAFSIIGRA